LQRLCQKTVFVTNLSQIRQLHLENQRNRLRILRLASWRRAGGGSFLNKKLPEKQQAIG
jgi:hypothetical protein